MEETAGSGAASLTTSFAAAMTGYFLTGAVFLTVLFNAGTCGKGSGMAFCSVGPQTY